MPARNVLSPGAEKQIVDEYRPNQTSTKKLAAKYGVGTTTIKRVLRREREPRQYATGNDEQAARLKAVRGSAELRDLTRALAMRMDAATFGRVFGPEC
jgi:transposase-like protein